YKSIDKIDVYTIDGYYPDSYIVYTLTEERLKDVDVAVPILYCYYVSTVMGRLCVSRTDVKTEVKAYMTNTSNNPGIIDLVNEVNERCEKLKAENAEYSEFIKTRNLDGTTKTPPTTEPPQPQSTDPNAAVG
nr:hypothetical protein [Lachnospiraceae bacterium]